MTPAARRKDAADFAALDGAKCKMCGNETISRAETWSWLNGRWSATIACGCGHHTTYATTRYRAVAMALAAYRAARRAGK